MTTTSPAPAPSPCERPDVPAPAPADTHGHGHDDATLLQDAAAARSWGAVDRRRDPRRRHR